MAGIPGGARSTTMPGSRDSCLLMRLSGRGPVSTGASSSISPASFLNSCKPCTTLRNLPRIGSRPHVWVRAPQLWMHVAARLARCTGDFTKSIHLQQSEGSLTGCDYRQVRLPPSTSQPRYNIGFRYKSWAQGKRTVVGSALPGCRHPGCLDRRLCWPPRISAPRTPHAW